MTRPATGYSFGLTSPCCTAPITPVVESRPTDAGSRSSAVAECTDCGRQWLVAVELSLAGGPRKKPARQVGTTP